MNMQDQTRKAFGYYARRQAARANAGELGPFTKALADMEPEINPRDDIGYDFDGDSLPDEKSYSRLAKCGYEAGFLSDDYVQPPKADDYAASPKADDYVVPPVYVEPVPEFDASQFEMITEEATKSVDNVGIDERQFDMRPTKSLQQ